MQTNTANQIRCEEIYERYRKLMYKTANEVLHNGHDAEDATHQGFINIMENIQRVDTENEPRLRCFVVTVARNCAIDILRKKNRMSGINILDWTDSAETVQIRSCIQQLPQNYREVILLKHYYGYSSLEAARILNTSETNIAKMHQRAKKKLEHICKEEGLL